MTTEMNDRTPEEPQLADERRELLEHAERWLETPMFVLGLVWLVLLVLDFTRGLGPTLMRLGTAIWILFIVDFVLRFVLAPEKLAYLRRNWLTAFSLLVPALRVLRIVRALRVLRVARAARGASLLRVISSVNRAMRGLGRTLGRRGSGYVAALTVVVLLAGAAGMLAFERDVADPAGIHDFGTALWWTTMVLTTMGSAYFPKTAEGRVLCVVLALYAFAVFGYVTATLATFFVARDAEDADGELAGAAAVDALRQEIGALRLEVRALGGPARGSER